METLLFLSSNKKWRHRLTHSPPRPLAAPTRAAGRAYVCDATLNRRPRGIRSQRPFVPPPNPRPRRAPGPKTRTHTPLSTCPRPLLSARSIGIDSLRAAVAVRKPPRPRQREDGGLRGRPVRIRPSRCTQGQTGSGSTDPLLLMKLFSR